MPASFSLMVKEELSRVIPEARHCRIAEIAAMLIMSGKTYDSICYKTENVTAARKYFTLLKKTFNIDVSVASLNESGLKKNRVYYMNLDKGSADDLIKACKIGEDGDSGFSLEDELILQRECCKRAFLRAAFMSSGSVSDPMKSYHFEIVCSHMEKALIIQKLILGFELPARIIKRKRHYVVYVKNSSQVVDLLNIMGAHKALMEMENVRILKDMRNRVNRSANFELANLGKTSGAYYRHREDIQLLLDTSLFSNLPEHLKEIAMVRLENPEASLAELGKMLDPPVGKSGVNHRLSKIGMYADEIRAGLKAGKNDVKMPK